MKPKIRAFQQDTSEGEVNRGRQWPRMVPTATRASALAIVLLVVLAGGATAQVIYKQATKLPDNAAFRVGDQVVTAQQLEKRTGLLKSMYGLQPPTDPAKNDKFQRDTAKAIAVSTLLDQEAKKDGIVVADKTANDQLAKLIKDSYKGDRDAFLQMLGNTGLSQQNVLDEIKRQQTSEQLFARVTSKAKKSNDDSARKYYDDHKKQMVSPEQREIRNIVVKSRQDADNLAQQARSGSNFAQLASQKSMDGQTKAKGGDLGMITADQLEPGYAKAAFGAKPSSVFGPVQTSSGWNVGQVTKIKQATPLSFDQLKQTIKTKLDNDALLQQWNGWLGDRLRDANVEYAPRYQPADPYAPPKQTTGQ